MANIPESEEYATPEERFVDDFSPSLVKYPLCHSCVLRGFMLDKNFIDDADRSACMAYPLGFGKPASFMGEVNTEKCEFFVQVPK